MSYMGTICPQGPEDCKSVGDLTISGNPPTTADRIQNMGSNSTPASGADAATVLDKAQSAVYGPRQDSYGHPRDNFAATAALWNAYLFQGVRSGPVTEEDVALMMVLLKVARLENGYHQDSVVDIAGYAATYERLQEPDLALAEALKALAAEPSPFVIHTPDRSPWPRLGDETWHDLRDVPRDVTVVDKDGDTYWFHFNEGRWYWTQRERYLDDADLEISSAFAPFTVAVDL